MEARLQSIWRVVHHLEGGAGVRKRKHTTWWRQWANYMYKPQLQQPKLSFLLRNDHHWFWGALPLPPTVVESAEVVDASTTVYRTRSCTTAEAQWWFCNRSALCRLPAAWGLPVCQRGTPAAAAAASAAAAAAAAAVAAAAVAAAAVAAAAAAWYFQ